MVKNRTKLKKTDTVKYVTIAQEHQRWSLLGMFKVKFVAGFEKGLVSKLLEYETDWMEVMSIILEILEIFPTSVKTVEEVLAKALDDWIISNDVNDNIKDNVT